MKKLYAIYFSITTSDGEYISLVHYTRKTKVGANNLVKKLAENSKASSLVKSDKFGLKYFRVPDADGDFISQGYITNKEVKTRKKATKSKKAKK